MKDMMKTTAGMLMALAAWLMAALPAQAQSRIEDQMKELESKNVMTDKIVKRDPKTKQVGMVTKNFRFYSQGGVVAGELREAFEAEARNATDVEREARGDNYECVLTFVSGRAKTVYRLSVSGDKSRPQVDMQMYFRDESVNIDESSIETVTGRGAEIAAATAAAQASTRG